MPVALDTFTWRDLAGRASLPVLVLTAVVVVALVLGGPADAVHDALRRVAAADPAWVIAAVALEFCSFAGYIALLAHVTGLSPADSYRTTVAGAAATRLLPTAGAGGAALTLWVLRRTGKGDAHTLLTFLVLLYAVFLVALFGAGFATGTPVVAVAAGVALLAAPFVPRLGAAVREATALLRRPHPSLLGAPAWWIFDCAVLWAAFEAVGAPPAADVLVAGYFLGQVANTIPVPGAASGGMIGIFAAFGVDPALAVAAVLTYRAIAVWLPAPAGAHALLALRRPVRRGALAM